MAVIYKTSETNLGGVIGGLITPLQSLSFMTFVLLYTPCLGTVAAQLQEVKSRNFALLSLGWSLLLALVAGSGCLPGQPASGLQLMGCNCVEGVRAGRAAWSSRGRAHAAA